MGADGPESRFTVSLDKLSGGIIGDHAQQTNVFQFFAEAAPAIAAGIRRREFQTLIAERTRGFVGRDFVFNAIRDLLRRPEFPSGYVMILGEPGIGKTAIAGELVNRGGYVHHFNVAAQNIRSVRDFLVNVSAQLIARYRLAHPQLPEDVSRDSGFLTTLLAEASAAAGNEPVVVLIDALDEADDAGLPPGVNRLYLPATLPPGTFFIVTTRTQIDYRLSVDRREDIYLRDDDPRNLEDIRAFIGQFIDQHLEAMTARLTSWQVGREEFVSVIADRSQGNFMYLVYVLRDIRDERLTAANIDNIRKLPQGLRDYYRRHWRQMEIADRDLFHRLYKPIVLLLAAVREPVSVEQIEQWTKLDRSDIGRVLTEWWQFLNQQEDERGDPLVRLYHASFQDFLRDEVGLREQHATIANAALSKIPGFGVSGI